MKVTFYQPTMEYSFEAKVTTNSVNVFCGTALNRFFEFVNCAQKVGAKTFKLNQPINLLIEANGKKYDTGKCEEHIRAKLKMNNSDKSKLKFAKNVFNAVKFSIQDVSIVSINEVFESFE